MPPLPPSVLVLSTDAVVAALLGTVLETEGFHVAFPAPSESPLASLERHAPAVALVDCDHTDACGEEFLASAAARSVRVLIFSPGRRYYEIDEVARRYGVEAFHLPIDRPELGERLRRVLGR